MNWALAALLLAGTGAVAGCSASASTVDLRLDRLEPLATAAPGGTLPLRVAIAAVISPQGTVESYQAFLDYLGRRLERPVELVQRRTYAEVNELVREGQVDLALVCTSAYILGHDAFGMEILAAPEVGGATVYHSVLLVPAASSARRMADLAGTTFAFTDPMSNTGRAYPTLLVRELGSRPETFFGRTFFTYSHDDAIRAVASGLADGAAVDSLVYDYALAREPDLAQRVKVIHRSPPFGIPPAVVGPQIRPQLKAALHQALLDMPADAAGRAALAAAGIDRFVDIEDAAYASARQLMTAVGPLGP